MTTGSTLDAQPTDARTTKSFSRYLPPVARMLMGLLFLVAGLNGFLNFLPQPATPMPEAAVAFAAALMKTGYLFKLVMGTQLIVGVLLLINRFVPLALALIAPIIVNIFTFHVFLAPSGIGPAVVVLILEIYLVWVYRKAFLPMLAVRA
ncbi:MAG: DoxX family protein [Candidatus Acidiferrales bacterium]